MTELTQRDKDEFFHSCSQGYAWIVERTLRKCPAILNEANEDGWTGLMLAVQWAQESIIELLLAKGADFNVPDRAGRTAADQAELLHFETISARFNAIRRQREEEAERTAREQDIQLFTRGLEAPLKLKKGLQLRK